MVQCAALGAADSSLRILISFDDVMLCHNLNTAWLAMGQPYCTAGLSEPGGGHCVLNGVLSGYFLGIKM